MHVWNGRWFYRMVNTKTPLEERWRFLAPRVRHRLDQERAHSHYDHDIQMLRRNGALQPAMLLLELSRDPAMIYWLDNCENHGGRINENYGRELLELFSMGIGNYTETDVKNVARAFTGWTFDQPIPLYSVRSPPVGLCLQAGGPR